MNRNAIALCVIISISILWLDRLALHSFATPDIKSLEDSRKLIIQYCSQHVDRVAAGEDVVQDLIKVGLLNQSYADVTCKQAQQIEEQIKSTKEMNDRIISAYQNPDTFKLK